MTSTISKRRKIEHYAARAGVTSFHTGLIREWGDVPALTKKSEWVALWHDDRGRRCRKMGFKTQTAALEYGLRDSGYARDLFPPIKTDL